MNTSSKGRIFVQVLSVLAVAVGAGLMAAGISIYPLAPSDSPSKGLETLGLISRDSKSYFEVAAILKGFGSGLLVLGGAGLVIPWINALVYKRSTAPGEP
ncbi:MAG: hypothetical protein ACKV19_28075 [Verrucomicrobiales bacterium]